MGKLIILAALLAIALAVLVTVLVIRAAQARKREHELDRGWTAQKLDIGSDTHIRLVRAGHRPRTEAVIPFEDAHYSDRVIEEFAAAQVKADDWNSTHRALLP